MTIEQRLRKMIVENVREAASAMRPERHLDKIEALLFALLGTPIKVGHDLRVVLVAIGAPFYEVPGEPGNFQIDKTWLDEHGLDEDWFTKGPEGPAALPPAATGATGCAGGSWP